MRLTLEQYRRGILSWDIDANVTFKTAAALARGRLPRWSEPLSDSSGSLVVSPPYELVALSIDTIDDVSALDRPYEIRWERLVKHLVVTYIWDTGVLPPPLPARPEQMILLHIPGYGYFHRLVVEAASLSWSEDIVFAFGNNRIRLFEGRIQGEQSPPMDQVTVTEKEISVTGPFAGSYEAEGRFIDIVASGQSPESAELNAHSYLGLVAAITGDQALGRILSSEPYEASPGHQRGHLRIAVDAKIPRHAEPAELDVLEQSLWKLRGDKRMDRAIGLALRWYEKGGRSEMTSDEFLAYFISIEAIINAYAAENSPLPEVTARLGRFDAILRSLEGKVPTGELAVLGQRLTESTLNERAKFYATRHGWEAESAVDFRQLARLRSDLVHGSASRVEWEHLTGVKKYLLRLLKTELNLPTNLGWETIPTIGTAILHYEYDAKPGHGEI